MSQLRAVIITGTLFLVLAGTCPQALAADTFPPAASSSASGPDGANAQVPLDVSVTATGDAGDLIPLKLGISLADFKAMADQQRAKYPTAHVMCSNDPDLQRSTSLALMRPMPDEQQAGIIRCNIFRPDPVNVSWWAPIIPAVDGTQIKSVTYFFLPSGSGYRLLFIDAVLPDQYLRSARQQLTAAIGSPQTFEETVWADHKLVTDIWKSSTMSVLIDSRTNSFRHEFVLSYVGTEMAELAAARGFGTRDAVYYSTFRHYR